ncbi:MAG: hypothetical protein AAB778_03755 [Patescibacteria group bacterium]
MGIDSLSKIAAEKETGKKKRKWFSLSTIQRHGKIKDINFSETEGTPVEQVVNRAKQAGTPSSNTGFAVGDITKQNLDQ